jgi:hypothetical protein
MKPFALALCGVLGVPAAAAPTSPTASASRIVSSAVAIVARQSFCVATGISDLYTGNGKVTFYLTLRNTGSSRAKVDVQPIRHYDDGAINNSPMDELLDVGVPAYGIAKYHSPSYSYKAHAHEIVACGVQINGGREVRIPVVHA